MEAERGRSAIVAKLRAAGCVFAEEEAELLIAAAETAAGLADMVDKRVSGVPLEHVIGWAAFCGLRIQVGTGVFVPRRRTEFLVSQAIAWARPNDIVVDMCCGSGAIGAAIASVVGCIELHAVDIDPVAILWARANIAAIGGSVYTGDLYEPLPAALQGRIDVLVANVPYVPTQSIDLLPAEARIYEAPVALDGGEDGLDVLRRVAAAAPQWLSPGGHLLVETSERQVRLAVDIIERSGLSPRVAHCEEWDATVVIGMRD